MQFGIWNRGRIYIARNPSKLKGRLVTKQYFWVFLFPFGFPRFFPRVQIMGLFDHVTRSGWMDGWRVSLDVVVCEIWFCLGLFRSELS